MKKEKRKRTCGAEKKARNLHANLTAARIPFVLFSFVLFTTCNDPVFYEISSQIKIPPPRVNGSPTAFAEINDIMYVASGNTIYYYNTTNGEWDKTKLNLGRITCLCKLGTTLFIISDNKLFKTSAPSNAGSYTELINSGHQFLTMYSAGNYVFIGSRKTDGSYSILYTDGGNPEEITGVGKPIPIPNKDDEVITTDKGILNGVAHNGAAYFLSVKDQRLSGGGGIYNYNPGSLEEASLIKDTYNYPIMGIISIGNNVFAIDRSGKLYNVSSGEITDSGFSTGKLSNGTLFVWKDPSDPSGDTRLLLAGRQDNLKYEVTTGFTYGYLEIMISGDDIHHEGVFREPGLTGTSDPSTLPRDSGSNDRFKTTLGTYPIKYLFQSSDSTLFASTHQNGVWSLRVRDKYQLYWNTER